MYSAQITKNPGAKRYRGKWILICTLAATIAGSCARLQAKQITLRHLYTNDSYYGGQRFMTPAAVFFDARHRELYVSDSGNSIIAIFAQDGKPLGSFQHRRKGQEGGTEPIGVVVNSKGTVFVSDLSKDRIYMYDYRGEPNGYMAMPRGTDGLLLPGKMTVDTSDNLYVAVRNAGIVVALGVDGHPRTEMDFSAQDKPGECCDVAIDGSGRTFALSSKDTAVHVFDERGKQTREFGDHGVGNSGFSRPSGIDIDSKGRLWITDSIRQVVKVLDEAGTFIEMFGGLGSGKGDFFVPTDVCIDRETDTLFVLEKNGRRLQAFAIVEK